MTAKILVARIVGVIIFIGLIATIGLEYSQLSSTNDQLQNAQREKAQVAGTLQANLNELSTSKSRVDALATQVADLQARFDATRTTEVKARTESISFKSDLDGSPQSYWLYTPEVLSSGRHPLIVYFHALGAGADEITKLKTSSESLVSFLMRRDAIVVSPTYRGDSWLNPSATADVTQVIRALKNRYQISSIVVSGISMGRTSALIYPLVAPQDVTVNGIVSAVFASDVIDLWSEGKNAQVKDSLTAAYGGSPTDKAQVYEARAVLRNLIRLPATMPIALYATYTDSMIPTAQQIRLRDALAKRGSPIFFAQIPGDHRVDGLDEGFAFVMNRTPAK